MSTISLFLLVIFWACMFVSDARTESTDSSTYYYEGSENDDAAGMKPEWQKQITGSRRIRKHALSAESGVPDC